MAFSFPEGSSFQFSTAFAAAKTITDITNADPAVATSTAHGYIDDDLVLLTSGWEDLNNSVVKVDQIDANSFSLLGVNSTNTAFYPVGSGGGSASLISSWQSMPQVLSISTSGGDPRYTTVQLLTNRNSVNIPTGFNATSINLTLAYDPLNAVFQNMLTVSRDNDLCAVRMVLSGGIQVVGYGYMSVNEFPTLNSNQVNQTTVSITLQARPLAY